MEKEKKDYRKPIALLLATIIFSVLTLVVDRQPIGLNDTSVGFATINKLVADSTPYNAQMDKYSDYFMYLAFAFAGFFAVYGLVQLIKVKSIKKVSKTIIGLGILYVIVMIIYVAFKKIPINYRPIIPPGETEPETSFPSSHTLVIVSVFGSAIVAVRRLITEWLKAKNATVVCIVFMVLGVSTRMMAGVHWLTDIIAGILFSLTLIFFYAAWSKD